MMALHMMQTPTFIAYNQHNIVEYWTYSPCRRGAHHLSPLTYGGGPLDLVVWVPQSPLGGFHVQYLQGTTVGY